MEEYEFTVEGMSCTGCEDRVTNATENVDEVRRVEADHEADSVEVTADGDVEDEVKQAIHDAGYDVAA
ncbi:MAG: heavy-metal-associated domain-containing protein [Halopenitus sp.]